MKKVGLISAAIYLGSAAVLGLLVFVFTLWGDYTLTDRSGAAAWTFILATIILMPIVIPAVRKRLG